MEMKEDFIVSEPQYPSFILFIGSTCSEMFISVTRVSKVNLKTQTVAERAAQFLIKRCLILSEQVSLLRRFPFRVRFNSWKTFGKISLLSFHHFTGLISDPLTTSSLTRLVSILARRRLVQNPCKPRKTSALSVTILQFD